MIKKIGKFLSEVSAEMKKVSWSTREEVLEATKVVMISTFLLGVFVASIDFVLSKVVGIILF